MAGVDSGSDTTIAGSKVKKRERMNKRICPELLILGRFGIRFDLVLTVWKFCLAFQLPAHKAVEIAQLVPRSVWVKAQSLLAYERALKRREPEYVAELLRRSLNRLKHEKPEYSASRRFTHSQIAILFLTMNCVGYFLVSHTEPTWHIIVIMLTGLYLIYFTVRLKLLADYKRGEQDKTKLLLIDESSLPAVSAPRCTTARPFLK